MMRLIRMGCLAVFLLLSMDLVATQAVKNKASLLSHSHYHSTCPDAEGIIHRKVQAWVQKDFTLAPAIIRLHFHDCAVRGCDASILLSGQGTERSARASKTLRGFQVIDEIKAELEKKCPKTVSCSDILTAAARDATILSGGPFWEVPFGRKDGVVSLTSEVQSVPQGRENVTALIQFFRFLGLDPMDLIALSGAHTIGRASCDTFNHRLYNFNRTGKPDPLLKPVFLELLRKQCRKSVDALVFLDSTTPRMFDTVFYSNLQRKMGLLSTDQALYSDARTASFVDLMVKQPFLFDSQFAASMVKLGNVGVLVGKNEGQIRVNCNFVNRNKE